MSRLALLNRMTPVQAETELLRCCGSKQWAKRVAAARPFSSEHAFYARATSLWETLPKEDWLEAFAQHPRIGEKKTSGWAQQEQAGAAGASGSTLESLATGNEQYEKRFGYVFLVCATGKTADEMLALLRARLDNDPETELEIAVREQAKITRLRLEKWLRP